MNLEDRRGLNIIIVGCGKVGVALTERLCKEGHNITLIDKNSEKIQALTSFHNVTGITGNGARYSVQMEAGIENADLIIAVTNSDELNLLCCTIATQAGGCAAIARVRTPDYSTEVSYLREKLGLAMIINPELETAREAARILYLPTALEVNTFAHGQVEMAKFCIPEDNLLDGMTIAKLSTKIRNTAQNHKIRDGASDIVVCAIERGGQIYIPSGNFCMEAGDTISFVTPSKNTKLFMDAIGMKTDRVKNTMIIGGGKAAYYLASELLDNNIEVKIIENNAARCEELSVLLPRAIIINDDGTDEEVLKREGIETIESFVPLTGIDEENILLTLYAKQVSDAKVITKINRITFKEVINSLSLGSVVYPRYITSEAIIAYVRAKRNSIESNNIETLYHMFDSRVEAIEFRVEEESAVTKTALKDLALKKDLLISFINRNGKIIIPNGNSVIRVNDTVMIVTTHTGLHNISDILEA